MFDHSQKINLMYLPATLSSRSFVIAFCLMALSLISLGQEKKPKLRFESYNAMGTLFGNATVHGQAQSVNGFSKGPWYLGLGVGLDEYRLRTVPVFADIRYRYGNRKSKWFAYADLGYSIATNATTGLEGSYYMDRNFNGGLYYDAGLGYQISMTKKGWGLFFSAGYCQKFASEIAKTYLWQPGILPLPAETEAERLEYRFSRISVKIGWKF
jgi:hypothetical protein